MEYKFVISLTFNNWHWISIYAKFGKRNVLWYLRRPLVIRRWQGVFQDLRKKQHEAS